MDPSDTLAILSLNPIRSIDIKSYKSNSQILKLKLEYKSNLSNFKTNSNLVNTKTIKSINELGSRFDGFSPKQLSFLENITNPFSKLGKSIFINNGSVKLANIDAVFNITNSNKGDLGILPTTLKKRYLYVVLGDQSGSIAQYIQYRKKFTLGYGMSHIIPQKEKETKALHELIETKGVNIYYREWGETENGGDRTGNLYINTSVLAEKVTLYHDGVDLVVGIADIKGTKDKEIETFRLLLNQLYGAISMLKQKGNAVIKCHDITKNITVQLVYIMSMCFEDFYIIKPVSSSPTSSERYLIGLGLRPSLLDKIQFLKKVNDSYSKYQKGPTNLIDPKSIPKGFTNYIRQTNQYIHTRVNNTLQDMYKQSRDYQKPKTRYNLSRLFMAWDIPSH